MSPGRQLELVKAHAYGNDFLLVDADHLAAGVDLAGLARRACDRHRGVGADGLMVVERTGARASMRLRNADGSPSELSGNGLRCVAAWLARTARLAVGSSIVISTEAGPKTLTFVEQQGDRDVFRAAMGHPEGPRQETLDLDGTPVSVVVLRVGNPQCVVLGAATPERLQSIAAPLSRHARFPEGTNVELAEVLAPERVRVLIWERGVGPTEASGTGACAAAVAAAAFGGAGRTVDVISPGGSQRVEWTDEGIWLTGWAELVARIEWWTAETAASGTG